MRCSAIDANAPANYELRDAGDNERFGDEDDTIFTLLPNYLTGDTVVSLGIADGELPQDRIYRLTISGTQSIHDVAGFRLDGDEDSQEGGDYVREFTVIVGIPGDLSGNAEVDAEDIDLLFGMIGGPYDPAADLSSDGEVNRGDVEYLVREILQTEFGDLNLDYRVNNADFGGVLGNFGRLLTPLNGQGTNWGAGDFNGDGKVDNSDFGTVLGNFGFVGVPPAVAAEAASGRHSTSVEEEWGPEARIIQAVVVDRIADFLRVGIHLRIGIVAITSYGDIALWLETVL